MITVTLHGRNGTRAIAIEPKGFSTRHVRVRLPETPKPPAPAPAPPACPVLAAIQLLTDVLGGDGYFVLDEIFLTVLNEGTDITRNALLETLRGYYSDGKVAFRPGYGSQLQFALKGDTP